MIQQMYNWYHYPTGQGGKKPFTQQGWPLSKSDRLEIVNQWNQTNPKQEWLYWIEPADLV